MKLFGPAFLVLGAILNILALFMLLPLLMALAYDSDNQLAFFSSAAVTSFTGILFVWFGSHYRLDFMQPRQVFLITSMAWLGVCIFGALPFTLASSPLTIADAFFESVSGVTTTGSSVINGLDKLPKDILLWRSILNWIGGIGIIGMAIAVLPFLRVGGMRLFKTESSDWSEKAMPRARSLMAMIVYTYLVISVLCCLAFWATGMDFFNAVNHMMATVSTGGFSTSDSSFAQFTNLSTYWVAIIFMLAGAVPFVLFVRMYNNRNHRLLLRDTQVKGLLGIVLICTILLTIPLVLEKDVDIFTVVTKVCFNLVSIITTTGFASEDYQLWGPVAIVIFYFATFIGGCSGSTTGGIKVFRLQIFAGLVKEQIITAVHPRAIVVRRYNNRLISSEIIASSISYMCLMAASLVVISLILAFTGLDFMTSFTGAATALMNVGPGLGNLVGPVGNFSSLTDTAKWSLSIGMLLGRLEFLTIFVLLSPAFWKA
jgi:trk system potassium uptake protein